MSTTFHPTCAICAICGKPILPLERSAYAWLPGLLWWSLVHKACKGDASPASGIHAYV